MILYTIRREFLVRRDQLSKQEQALKSKEIRSRLVSLPVIDQARCLFIYVGFRSEVRTVGFINNCIAIGKKVCVPLTLVESSSLLAVHVTDPDMQLQPGYCSIPEPTGEWARANKVNPREIDVVLVPGSVFDRKGGRMGYGGGYYDRFLSREAPRATRVGLAYELQIVEQLLLEPHDQKMDIIVTENKIYTCGR
ncbi:MAG: 5-formyltetrahydrofolate cyclo-ligase [Desulfobulbaceae bacterium]|nr:5-formyltetrahydrofolate cyclo-ligase [Desulfobulbaceae bacterium]